MIQFYSNNYLINSKTEERYSLEIKAKELIYWGSIFNLDKVCQSFLRITLNILTISILISLVGFTPSEQFWQIIPFSF